MAVASGSHANSDAFRAPVSRGVAQGGDCEDEAIPDKAHATDTQHDDCDCASAGCACSCMLTFYPGRMSALFVAHHTLDAVYLPPPLLPAVRHEVSRVFRPPIV